MKYLPPKFRFYFVAVGILNLINLILPEIFLGLSIFVRPLVWLFFTIPALLIYPAFLLPIYWLRRASKPWRLLVVAICSGVIVLIGLGLPYAERDLLEAMAQELLAGDVELAEPPDPQSVALHSTLSYFEGYEAHCEELCLRLLFGEEVRRFTAIGHDGQARIYWLERGDQCPRDEDLYRRWPAIAAWASKGKCLKSMETVDPNLDLIIRIDRSDDRFTTLGHNFVDRHITISEPGPEGRELARRSQVSYSLPYYPLLPIHVPDLKRSGRWETVWSWQFLNASRHEPETLDLFDFLRSNLGFQIADISPPR